jgi:hypothetical protein
MLATNHPTDPSMQTTAVQEEAIKLLVAIEE